MATPEQAVATMAKNLQEKTGKSLYEWVKIARGSKFTRHGQIVQHLKSEHGLTHGYANLVALNALQASGEAPADGDALVNAQYAGGKTSLRPIYRTLIQSIRKFGTDVEVSPKKTYVSLRRSKQFALIQPSTATRLDVGINLKDRQPTERLEASGSFNAMVSHRVRLEKLSDVDDELTQWLRDAYEAS